jgi:hypothetical protein
MAAIVHGISSEPTEARLRQQYDSRIRTASLPSQGKKWHGAGGAKPSFGRVDKRPEG